VTALFKNVPVLDRRARLHDDLRERGVVMSSSRGRTSLLAVKELGPKNSRSSCRRSRSCRAAGDGVDKVVDNADAAVATAYSIPLLAGGQTSRAPLLPPSDAKAAAKHAGHSPR